MRNKRTIKRWVKHIINKFGKEIAEGYANSNKRCPCTYAKWICSECEYKRRLLSLISGCKDSIVFDRFMSNDWEASVKRLRKRLRNLKKLILKEL